MPFLIPILAGLLAFTTGAFTGAQVDDAIEQPDPPSNGNTFPEGFPNGSIFSFSNLLKLGLIAGIVWVGARSFKLIK